MNNERRKIIAQAAGFLDQAKALLEQARDDEQTAFDNLPESIQAADRGQQMEETLSTLQEKIDDLETLQSDVQEIAGNQS